MAEKPEFEPRTEPERRAWETALRMQLAGEPITSRKIQETARVGQRTAIVVARHFTQEVLPDQIKELCLQFAEKVMDLARSEVGSKPSQALILENQTLRDELAALRNDPQYRLNLLEDENQMLRDKVLELEDRLKVASRKIRTLTEIVGEGTL